MDPGFLLEAISKELSKSSICTGKNWHRSWSL